MWAYRRGSGIIPGINSGYGGHKMKLRIVGNFSSIVRIEIKRTEINALDKLSQRCEVPEVAPSVSQCVEEQFVERYLNCSLNRLMSNPNLSKCNQTSWSSSEEDSMHQMFERLNIMDEREIFDTTGCMPGCYKSKIQLDTRYQDNMIDDGKQLAKFLFYYDHGEYDLLEEYYIYNWGSFIADVGGYMGLLLGYSVMGMYHMTTPIVMKQVEWLAKKMSKRKAEIW